MKTKTKKRKPLTLRKYDTMTLLDLPGVEADETRAVEIRSPSDASQFMRKGLPVAACGDNGAITVWKDDAGNWRCELCRFRAIVATKEFKSLAAAWECLKEWWPQMRKS